MKLFPRVRIALLRKCAFADGVLVWPIFERGAGKMVKDGVLQPVDILPYAQQTMGQVSIRIFLGEVSSMFPLV